MQDRVDIFIKFSEVSIVNNFTFYGAFQIEICMREFKALYRLRKLNVIGEATSAEHSFRQMEDFNEKRRLSVES